MSFGGGRRKQILATVPISFQQRKKESGREACKAARMLHYYRGRRNRGLIDNVRSVSRERERERARVLH